MHWRHLSGLKDTHAVPFGDVTFVCLQESVSRSRINGNLKFNNPYFVNYL